MKKSKCSAHGIELLVEKCRNEFRCPENTDYYTENDYKEAERKFVKFCLDGNIGHWAYFRRTTTNSTLPMIFMR
jgi:hypothetical protein